MKIQIPEHCPSCSFILERVGPALFCKNSNCLRVNEKIVQNFASTLKIKGLGPVSIQKLEFTSILDIYAIDEEEYCAFLGQANGKKVFAEVEKSKNLNMSQVLPALSIPQVAKGTTEKLAKKFASLYTIMETEKSEVARIIGPAAASKLFDWIENNSHIWENLPQSFEFDKQPEYTKVVCITGRLKSFKSKAQATTMLNANGYKVVNTLSKSVDYLINEGGKPSAKTEKAEKFGITIITSVKELFK